VYILQSAHSNNIIKLHLHDVIQCIIVALKITAALTWGYTLNDVEYSVT